MDINDISEPYREVWQDIQDRFEKLKFKYNMDMSGDKCPNCNKTGGVQLLATTNEWKYFCGHCNVRFNDNKEILKPSHSDYDK